MYNTSIFSQYEKEEIDGNVTLVLTFPRDDDFTEWEVSFRTLIPEPDHHIAPSLSAAMTLKLFLALERRLILIGTDLVVCNVGRWRDVRHSDVEVVQPNFCKIK